MYIKSIDVTTMPKGGTPGYFDWANLKTDLAGFDGIVQIKKDGKWIDASPVMALAWIHRFDDPDLTGNKWTVKMKWISQGWPDPNSMKVVNTRTGKSYPIRALTPT